MSRTDEKLTPLDHTAQNHCFGCGEANTTGLRLEFFRAEDGSVVSLPAISDFFEGPKGFVHGGIIATLLDETMSKAVRTAGFTAMTRHMSIEYLRPVPCGTPIRLVGRVIRSEGRKHWTEAMILNEQSATLATGKGLFVEVNPDRVRAQNRN